MQNSFLVWLTVISCLEKGVFFNCHFFSSFNCVYCFLKWKDTCLPAYTDELWNMVRDCLDNYPVSLSDKSLAQKNFSIKKNAIKVGATQINSILAPCRIYFAPDCMLGLGNFVRPLTSISQVQVQVQFLQKIPRCPPAGLLFMVFAGKRFHLFERVCGVFGFALVWSLISIPCLIDAVVT